MSVFKEYSLLCHEELKDLIRTLAVIPAPSHHEDKRVAFVKAWMEAAGAENIIVDDAKNVIWPYHVTDSNDVVVIMAHTDLVFSEEVPLVLREENGRFYCPGISDDTARLAELMIMARYFTQNAITPTCGILFVANSCEEGLGNLKGSRAIVDTYGERIKEFITFDGDLGGCCSRAVGSDRYKVTVETEGGHSYGAFGNRNAIRVMASMIDTLYSVKVPQKSGTKTTYNVGGISGGTSVNTIAQSCEMLYEYRSDDLECLETMRNMFKKVIEAYRATGVEVTVELLGERPCSGKIDPVRHQALIDKVTKCYADLGYDTHLSAGSTDANYPLFKGIPAVCVGATRSGGAHTLGEWCDIESLKPGMEFMMSLTATYFEM